MEEALEEGQRADHRMERRAMREGFDNDSSMEVESTLVENLKRAGSKEESKDNFSSVD